MISDVNQLILLVLQAVNEGKSEAEGVNEYQFIRTRDKLRRMSYLFYSYSDKGYHLNYRGQKLIEQMKERVVKGIIGNQ